MDKIQLFVRSGGKSKQRSLVMKPTATTDELIREISKQFANGVEPENLYIICAGKQIEYGKNGNTTLQDLKLASGSFVDFCQRVVGGTL